MSLTGKGVITAPKPCRHDRRPRRDPGDLTDEERARIRAAVLALPPMSDDQVDALAEAVAFARARNNARRHHDH